jgi:hypothetical protein
MAYLDVSPMVVALRTSAGDFEMDRGWLHHFPSHHRFKISDNGFVRLYARCDCSHLKVVEQQGYELRDAFREWQDAYWRPIEVNREFASHFRSPGPLRRFTRSIIRKIRLALQDPLPGDEESVEAPSMIPAE